jgi:hypothetical protein
MLAASHRFCFAHVSKGVTVDRTRVRLLQLLVRVGHFLLGQSGRGTSKSRSTRSVGRRKPAADGSDQTDVERAGEFMVPPRITKISADYLITDDTIGLLVALAAIALAVVYGWRDANDGGGPPSPPSPPGGTPNNDDDGGAIRFRSRGELQRQVQQQFVKLLKDPDTRASAEELLEIRALSLRQRKGR